MVRKLLCACVSRMTGDTPVSQLGQLVYRSYLCRVTPANRASAHALPESCQGHLPLPDSVNLNVPPKSVFALLISINLSLMAMVGPSQNPACIHSDNMGAVPAGSVVGEPLITLTLSINCRSLPFRYHHMHFGLLPSLPDRG